MLGNNFKHCNSISIPPSRSYFFILLMCIPVTWSNYLKLRYTKHPYPISLASNSTETNEFNSIGMFIIKLMLTHDNHYFLDKIQIIYIEMHYKKKYEFLSSMLV